MGIEGIFRKSFNGIYSVFPIIVLCSLASGIFFIVQRNVKKNIFICTVTADIKLSGRCFRAVLMIDSGNLAFEPITGKRIIFIGSRAASGLCISSDRLRYPIRLKTASGTDTVMAFEPDDIIFDMEQYNNEKFLVIASNSCSDFAGFDGIAPIIRQVFK